jgi:anti-sigma regulatory factor (Ser/Thr protein kinase)
MAPLEGLRLRADVELYEPYSLEEVLDALQNAIEERAERPGYRTLALDYSPQLETQKEAERLVESMLASCGLPECSRYMFHCGVREALDNARRHGTQFIPAENIDTALKAAQERKRRDDLPSERAKLWFEADDAQVTVSIASKRWVGVESLADIFGKAVEESAPATAKRRSREGRPGGLGFHIMQSVTDELRYESGKGAVCLMKRL